MTTYSRSDFVKIADAVDESTGTIEAHAKEFEAAALWYRSSHKAFEGRTPRQLQKKMEQIAQAARRLLDHLGVKEAFEAFDGPGDSEILEALTQPEESSEDVVIEATRQIGRLVEILDAIEAAQTLERLASEAITEVKRLGELTVPKGNPGDLALNDWIARMMGIYKKITKTEPATSVGASGSTEGEPGGPLIRFLTAAGEPLNIVQSPSALRSRVRQILKWPDEKTESDLAISTADP